MVWQSATKNYSIESLWRETEISTADFRGVKCVEWRENSAVARGNWKHGLDFTHIKVLHITQAGTAPFQSLRLASNKGFIGFTTLIPSHPVSEMMTCLWWVLVTLHVIINRKVKNNRMILPWKEALPCGWSMSYRALLPGRSTLTRHTQIWCHQVP